MNIFTKRDPKSYEVKATKLKKRINFQHTLAGLTNDFKQTYA